MKTTSLLSFLFSVLASLFTLCALSGPQPVRATPYASGVVVSGGTVTFILNEAADNVTVQFDGGASSLDLGARGAGPHSFNLGGATSYQIVVHKVSGPGYLQGVVNQISSDTNVLMRFINQRGVAVNKNPASPLFGRIYVSVSQAGTNTASGRGVGDGIYVINPDLTDALGQGNAALTGGINFTNGASGNVESPHRLTVGADDRLYIGDWSDTSGSLYVTDGNVSGGENVFGGPTGSAFPVLSTSGKIHGSISAAWTEGSLAAGNLTVYVVDEDLQTDKDTTTASQRNSIWRWDIGAGPLPGTNPPTRITGGLIGTAAQLADLVRGTNGNFYVSQRRAEPATSSGLLVRSSDGTGLWSSLTATRNLLNNGSANDLLGESGAIDISSDGKYLAVLRRDTNSISILPLIDGLPDLTNRIVLPTAPSTGVARDISFDVAGNLYAVSSGQGLLRVYSPGGRTTATTGSDGTFNVVTVPIPSVTVTATDSQGAEEGAGSVAFTFTRNQVDVGLPLTISYTLTGLAANGTDYPLDPLSVTIAANETAVTVTLTPIDDSEAELTENVVVSIAVSPDYSALISSVATATILDNEPLTLRLTSDSKTNVYEPLPADTITLQVLRLGNLAADVFGAELILSGVATELNDFVLSTNYFYLPQGVVTQLVTLAPVNDFLLEGNESVTITLGQGSGDYAIDAQNSVTGTIRDDDLPPVPVLFAEDFNTDVSAQWQARFGANNGIYDATVNWTYDYGSLGIGLAPKTVDGSTLGLYAAVNKTNGTGSVVGGSAGINFYPIGQSFHGDYALRFDMYLSYGATFTTEHALLGINHSGNLVNRATQSTDANNTTAGGDGFWVGIATDASNLRDYSGYTYPTPTSLPTVVVERAASTLTSQITSPPYSLAGSPGSSGNSRSWSEVELMQVNNLITLKVNNVQIWQHQNTNNFTSGNIMLGMNDQFDSVGTNQHFVVFDNVRVVSLAFRITSFQLLPNDTVQIDFQSPLGGQAANFRVETKSDLSAPEWTDTNATVEADGLGFRAVVPRAGGANFFRIVRTN